MKKHLITNDLISSVKWCLQAPDSIVKDQPDNTLTWKRKAFIDLQNKLNRVYGDMPIAAQRGIDFENKLYNCAKSGLTDVGSDHFKELINRVKHHNFQEKVKLNMLIGDYACFIYGKIDAYLPKDMIDIKTTANFKLSNYTDSMQHKLYCLGKNETKFTYIVIEWLDYPKIKQVHYVPIELPNLKIVEEEIKNTVLQIFETLKELDLWEIYRDKYCLY